MREQSIEAADTNGLTGVGPDEGFRGAQVCALVGITYRQLDYWARTNLLRPSITDATGSGSQRRYAYRDVLELKVIKAFWMPASSCSRPARRSSACGATWGSIWPRPNWS